MQLPHDMLHARYTLSGCYNLPFVILTFSVCVRNQVILFLTICAWHNLGGFERQLGGPFIGSVHYPTRTSSLQRANTG